MKRVVLHIDRLVLKGFGQEDRDAIAQGLKTELARLLASPEARRQLMAHDGAPRLKIAALRIAAGACPTAIGEQAAQGIAHWSAP